MINWNSWIRFLKNQIWLVQTSFFKTFQNFFSLSPTQQGSTKIFFVVFLQISCKVSLSLSQYVYITLPFALFFTFSCIISWFLGNFWTMHNLGFLIIKPCFMNLINGFCCYNAVFMIYIGWFDQFGDLWKIKNSRACIEPDLGILLNLMKLACWIDVIDHYFL